MAYTCHYWIRGLCDGVIWRRKITNTAVFPGDAVIKNPSASEGDTGDFSSTPGSGKSPGGGNIHSCQYFFFFFFFWKIPWTEEPVGLQLVGLQRIGHD